MRFLLYVVCSVLLAACASVPQGTPAADALLDDTRFAPPSQRIDAGDVFALNDAMKRYLDSDIGHQLRMKGAQRGLIDALYTRGDLKLEYDTAMTRNASQAFDARSGNCLSLVIMTAAFAKQLGLPVRYQSVYVPETWSRNGNLYFSSGHVNLSIGKRAMDAKVFDLAEFLTIDFLPPRDLRGLLARTIDEDTIIAMYLNNRAAESLAEGRIDDAYWYVRAAMKQMPTFLTAYNTLGVVYTLHGDAAHAARVLQHVVAMEPGNRQAMANLVPVLERLGRTDEARDVAARLARLEPQPPFHYFNQGVEAMHARDYSKAKSLFQKEIDRAAYYHEFHFWLALANLGLGDTKEARRHLATALENSTTSKDHDLYAAKLEHLKPTRLR
jgi:thioredoxin-like negative regulator of GroEL